MVEQAWAGGTPGLQHALVKHAHLAHPFMHGRDHLDCMFGPEAPALEWDEARDYERSKLEVYYLSHASKPLSLEALTEVWGVPMGLNRTWQCCPDNPPCSSCLLPGPGMFHV